MRSYLRFRIKQLIMANWELREKRNKRKALVLSILLHVIVLGGLAVYTGAGEDSTLRNFVNNLFENSENKEELTFLIET